MMHARLIGTIACALLAATALPGCQARPAASTEAGEKKGAPPRTADGKPDLRGVWAYATITPLERPSELGGKEFFTEQEAAAFEKETAQTQDRDRRDADGKGGKGPDGRTDLDRAYTNLVGLRIERRGNEADLAQRGYAGWANPSLDAGGAEEGRGQTGIVDA